MSKATNMYQLPPRPYSLQKWQLTASTPSFTRSDPGRSTAMDSGLIIKRPNRPPSHNETLPRITVSCPLHAFDAHARSSAPAHTHRP